MLGPCYALFRGRPDPEFGFGFGVPGSIVGWDEASVSGLLRRLDFHVRYLRIVRGHAAGRDGEAGKWTKEDDDGQRSNAKEFLDSSNVYN